jgi:hypothetical protein
MGRALACLVLLVLAVSAPAVHARAVNGSLKLDLLLAYDVAARPWWSPVAASVSRSC